jgi:hypothetical protein
MKTIWKFPLEITDRQIVEMPHECAPLTVQMQNDRLCLWAIADPDKSPTGHPVIIVETGNPFPEEADGFAYIGSVQKVAWGGSDYRIFSWHVFVGVS